MAQRIREVMKTDPISLEFKSPVLEAAKTMRESNIGNVLVTKNGKLCGIVTDRDLVVRCLAEGVDPSSTQLGDLCSDELVTLGADEGTDAAVKIMREKAIRRIPVVDGDKPIGIVSIGDLAVTCDSKSALADISAAPPNR